MPARRAAERDGRHMETDVQKPVSWDAFVQGDVVNFFNDHQIEKLTIDDGSGNKAKLTRMKDCGIKIESSSTTTI